MSRKISYIAFVQKRVPDMKAFIGVLVLCGIYSSHSASVGISAPAICANNDDGSFLPVVGDCSLFYMCLKGEAIKSSCGYNLHFDPVGKECIDISRSKCVSGKKTKPVLTKQESGEIKTEETQSKVEQKPETKPQLEEVKPKPTESKPQAELKPEKKPEVEEVKPQQTQSKPQQTEEAKPQITESKPQQTELKPEKKPELQEVKIQVGLSKPEQAEQKPEKKPESEEVKPQQTEEIKPLQTLSKVQQTEVKPEAKPQTEEAKPKETQSKPQQAELKPEAKPQSEEAKPQESQSKPEKADLKPEKKPEPEEVKSQELLSKPQPEEVKPQESEKAVLKPETKPEEPLSKPEKADLKPETKPAVQPDSEKAVTSAEFCTGKAVGSFIPSKVSCNEYYVCLGSRIVLKTCPTGLHFNPDVRSCTIPSLANCIAEVPAEEKPQKPDTLAISPISTESVCIGKANGAMFPIPGSCSGYFACLQENTYELSCGVRHFDPVSRACIQVEESQCIESKKNVVAETKDSFIGDSYLGNDNSGIVVGNANVQIDNTGSVSNVNLISSSSDVAVGNTDLGLYNSYEVSSSSGQNKAATNSYIAVTFNGDELKNSSIGNTDLGQNNSGISIGNANLNINNTGNVKNTNVVLASQNVAVGNTDLGTSNSYNVNGSNLIVNNSVIPIKQTGLPVNKKQVSHVDKVDIEVSSSGGVAINAAGVKETKDIDIGDTNLGTGNTGISIGNANVNISNSGSVVDVNIVSGSKNAVAGNTNLGSYNSVVANGVSIPEVAQIENKELVIAVVDEESTRICAGVPSGTLFPKLDDCGKFITCEDGVAFVGACPHGLHFNALMKLCDWKDSAGCV